MVLTIDPLFPVPEVTSLHINCGGNQTTIGGITYDEDIYPAGPAVYKQIGNNWALSNTGLFMDNDTLPEGQLPPYTTKNETRLDMTNAELYKNARVSPMSLSYYGFCLANGVYTVKLHFAEIMFTDDNTYSDLGRRVFDVYIQGKRVLKDFNIANEAQGVGKEVIKEFPAHVSDNDLEIRFYWAGKGTTYIPYKSVNGPLISAISVTYDGFSYSAGGTITKEDSTGGMSAGVIVVIAVALVIVVILITVSLLRWRVFINGCCHLGQTQTSDVILVEMNIYQWKDRFHFQKPINWSPFGSERSVMEGKLSALEGRMEGRLNVIEGQMKAIKITMDGLKAETTAMRQELQELTRILGGRTRNLEGNSEGSQMSVNENRRGRREGVGEEREVERNERQPSWKKRVNLPIFEGLEPLNWINRAEKFFEIQGVTEQEKLSLAYISMEGRAGYWFRFWKVTAKNLSWEGLKEAMIRRFEGRDRGTIFERLAAIKQAGTVDEYVQDFEVLVGQTKGIPEEQLLGYFFAGLQEDIRSQIRPYDPQELMAAMRIARDLELAHRGARTGGWNVAKNPGNATAKVGITTGSDNRGRGTRNLPYAEYLKWEEESRCFRCGGPFSSGHHCPERSLRVLILGEDEEGETEEEEAAMDQRQMELSAMEGD
ncbi:hypothetical protein V8G54_027082 [Vigna mungo]|uniref:Malectin domain-containing protein n=1 Tax=Vigna mungo TaxID=3915 RepID=A0AAQ3N0Q1_VIGMU